MEKAVSRLLTSVFRLNFAESVEVPKIEVFDSEDNNKALMERDAILVKAGIKLKNECFQRADNLCDADIE